MDFLDWDHLILSKPFVEKKGTQWLSKKEVVQIWEDQHVKKNFVVVILEKPFFVKKSLPIKTMDEIEKFLVDQGFQRIVLQQAVGSMEQPDGLPILRDHTTKTK